MTVVAELFPNGITELFQWDPVLFKGTDFGLNKTGIMVLVSMVICLTIFLIGGRKRALVPTGLQNVAESGYLAIESQIAVEVMGTEEGKKWTPFLASLFFYILFINIWSIIPGIQFPATARIALPGLLAIIVWVVFIGAGFKTQGPLYIFKNITPPGVPKPLYILVIPIEFISKYLVRPFSLAVRLFANMVAGHVLLTVFAVMCIELWKHQSGAYQIAFIPLPFFGLLFMTAFEVLVALLQAYIFTILTAVYIGESVHPEH
ncbi:F0F1-type ATP synthase, alpha subunit [Actinobacteria bacterium IMCC26256]|nr:F0F1-type ATP synthase, alpha subunit [Actinobacteria bacterium IMCC26256]